ncbi:hypothetical protein KI387_027884, partial [Taxus chinensis]
MLLQLSHPESRKRSGQILQTDSSKKLKQDSSRSIDSGLPERPGWCYLCEVDCKTEVVLKDHILGKKHQRMLKLEDGSGDRRERDSKQRKLQTEQQQQKRDVIDNHEKNEKQGKKCKRSSNTNQLTVE